MSQSQERGNQAAQTAIRNAELQVAINLKRSWGQIRIAVAAMDTASGRVPPRTLPENPGDSDFQRMALELIDSPDRSFHLPDGQTLSLTELDESPELVSIRQQLQIRSFRQMVPTRSQINMIAGAVGSGVEENTGDIGFLGGATIGSAFMGFFKWMFSGFRGGFQGLKDTIAGLTAGNMSQSVTTNLTQLRYRLMGTPDDISSFMTDQTITNIGGGVRTTVMNLANPNLPASTSETLAGTNIGDLAPHLRQQAQARIRTQIRTEIIDGIRNNELFADIRDTFNPDGTQATRDGFLGRSWETVQSLASDTSRTVFGLGPRQRYEAANNVANTISDRLSAIIADPNYTYQGNAPHLQGLKNIPLSRITSASDRAAVLAEEARVAVAALADGARNNGETKLADFYLLMSARLPGEMQVRLTANTPLHTTINALTAPGTINTSSALPGPGTTQTRPGSGPNVLTMLLDQPDDRRRGLLDTVLRESLGGDSANALQFRQVALNNGTGTITDPQYRILSHHMNEALQEIQDRMREDHPHRIPASGPERYEAIAQIMRDHIASDSAREHYECEGLQLTKPVMEAMADRVTIEFLGTPADYQTETYADFRRGVSDREQLAAQSVIDSRIRGSLVAEAPRLKMLAGGELKREHHDAIINAAMPVLRPLAMNPSRVRDMGANAYRQISDDIYTSLTSEANKRAINQEGVNLSNESLRVIADNMALEFVQQRLGAQAPSPAGYSATRRTNLIAALRPIVREQVSDNTATFNGVLATLPGSGNQINSNNLADTITDGIADSVINNTNMEAAIRARITTNYEQIFPIRVTIPNPRRLYDSTASATTEISVDNQTIRSTVINNTMQRLMRIITPAATPGTPLTMTDVNYEDLGQLENFLRTNPALRRTRTPLDRNSNGLV